MANTPSDTSSYSRTTSSYSIITSLYPTSPAESFPPTSVTISTSVPISTYAATSTLPDGQQVTSESVIYSLTEYVAVLVPTDVSKGNSTPQVSLNRIPMIIGVSLAALFLITMPIAVWLVLRYRRRPARIANPGSKSDKHLPPSDTESLPDPYIVDLLEPNTPISNFAANNPASTEETRQIWIIIDGEKQQITIPRRPSRSAPPSDSQDPFADPTVSASRQSLPRIAMPHSSQSNDSISSSFTTLTSTLPLGSRGNTAASHTPPNPVHSQPGPSAETHAELISRATRLLEKAYRPRRQRPAQDARPLSSEEIAARILVPGRAVDMGPLGRNRIEEVNESGLLPPNYSQATQPVSSSERPPQVDVEAR